MGADSLILHTDSGHFTEVFNIGNPNDLKAQSGIFLSGQERKVYQWVGANNFKQFMDILRQLFKEAEDVNKALSNFQKSNLIIEIGLPRTVNFIGQQIDFTLSSETSEDIVNRIREQLVGVGNDTIKITKVNGKPLRFSFEYNETNIKTFLNTYYSDRKFTDNSKNRAQSSKSNGLRYANKAIRELADGGKIGEIVINKTPVTKKFTVDISQGISDSFNFRSEDIDKALKNKTIENLELANKILEARKTIYNTLLGFMNGIPTLEEAFKRAWKKKMGAIDSKDTAKILNQFKFFAKGDNLSAGVSGAIQELYAAIIGEYINIKIGKGIRRTVATVLGNIAEGGEQPKTDVQILESIGLQVKAFMPNQIMQKMTTNIHPGALQAALDPFGVENVADTIVQMVFNADSGDYQSLAADLEPAMAQLMSFSTSEQVLRRTVCFYMIDATFVIPASHILSTLRHDKNYTIKIRTSFDTKSDDYFKEKGYMYTDKNGRNIKKQNLVEFFRGEKADWDASFGPEDATDENKDLYNTLMNKSISIDVTFDYGFMMSQLYAFI